MAVLVTIAEHSLPNCFGYLSDNAASFPNSNSFGIFHCSKVDKTADAACLALQVFANRPPFNFVHLNRTFLDLHGFKVGDQVVLETVAHVPFCQWMEIVPESFNDWNVIENTSCIIEEIFLSQIRVLQSGMRFVLHLSAGVAVNLRVAQLAPKGVAAVLVTNSTQVLVAPVNEKSGGKQKTAELLEASRSPSVDDRTLLRDPIALLLSSRPKEPSFLRVAPPNPEVGSELPPSTIVALSDHETYVKTRLVQAFSPEISAVQFATLILIPKAGNGAEGSLLPVYEHLKNEPPGSCWPSIDLRSAGFHPFLRLKCRHLRSMDVKRLQTVKYTTSIEVDVDHLKSRLNELFAQSPLCAPVLIPPDGVEFKLQYEADSAHHFLFRLQSEELNGKAGNRCGYFWPDRLPKFEEAATPIKLKSDGDAKKPPVENFAPNFADLLDFSFQRPACALQIQKLVARLQTADGDRSLGHLLIVGAEGSGKSALLRLIAAELYERRRVVALRIDCSEFKGKSPETIGQSLEPKLKALGARWPAVLLLDNLDFLNAQVEDEERRRFVARTYLKMGELINESGIQVVAAVQSKKNLPEALLNLGGCSFFPDLLEIPPLKKADCAEVIERLLAPAVEAGGWRERLEDPRLDRLERLNLGQVVKLCERIRLEHPEEAPTLGHLLEALAALPTAGRSEVKRPLETGGVSFDDVGGCADVKRKLREVFIWPMRFPEIFANAGVRIGHGAVLHGPSGCGKTLLARAMEKETGFNVIFVKGPELLSKYIGASEENVRKVFQRARQSRPSLVVFDEFDSLVPKRGHDSTGVTDRVVNQFLTELDGVDTSMEGVYVLAATSRIELIDVALLRPGRLGQKISVELPSEEERAEILRIQSRDLRLENPDVLREVATRTGGWSGAELRGLIVNASFVAARTPAGGKDEEPPEVTVAALNEAFDEMLKERKRKTRPKVVEGPRVSLA